MKSASSLLIAFILMVVASGCGKDESPIPTQVPSPVSRMSAKINGAVFYASEFSVSSTTTSYFINGATSDANRRTSVSFTIPNYAGLTSYNIDTTTTAAFTQLGIAYLVTSGAITITTDNAVHTAGTFYLQASAGSITKDITDGSFDIYK